MAATPRRLGFGSPQPQLPPATPVFFFGQQATPQGQGIPRLNPNQAPGAPGRAQRPAGQNNGRPSPRRLEPQFIQVAAPKNYDAKIKKLKIKIEKLTKNLEEAVKSKNKNKNNLVELKQLLKNQQRELISAIKERSSYFHRYSGIRGMLPTNYASPYSYHRYYRDPHRNLWMYYQNTGMPRYLSQLPARAWHLNQGGWGLPQVPFFTRRRRR